MVQSILVPPPVSAADAVVNAANTASAASGEEEAAENEAAEKEAAEKEATVQDGGTAGDKEGEETVRAAT